MKKSAQKERRLGALHIHSAYSSDAEWPLEKCKEVFQKEGYRFIGLTEHIEDLNDRQIAEWNEKCRSLSDAEFLFIPGFEFSFSRGIHLLGFGLRERIAGGSIGEVIDQIDSAGGVAVWAHPTPEALNMIYSYAERLSGMEIWNGRYHGERRPPFRLLSALERVRSLKTNFYGFGGIDFHKEGQDRGISVVVESGGSVPEILEALRNGKFYIRREGMTIPSTGALSLTQQIGMALNVPFWSRGPIMDKSV